jgi:hypothetical protein
MIITTIVINSDRPQDILPAIKKLEEHLSMLKVDEISVKPISVITDHAVVAIFQSNSEAANQSIRPGSNEVGYV